VRSLLTGTVALTVLFAVGCGREALNFNNAIANNNKKLNEAGKKFGDAIDLALKGKEANADAVEAAYKGLADTVKQVMDETKGFKAPESTSGQSLAKGYQKFLETEKKITENEFAKITKAIKDNKAPMVSEGSMAEQLKTLLREANDQERAALAKLHEAQREFAKEHGLTLKAQSQ
jgi:hypothetical protein